MIIHELFTQDLVPYENNPRHNDEAVDIVAKSIEEFGFKVPIVIDENMVIITGHTRLKAALKLGIEKVPCIMADDLTDEQIKAFRLADNKTSEFATWDIEKLNLELEQLEELDFDMKEFGFEFKKEEIKDDDFDLTDTLGEIGPEPITKRGDIWKLGRHRLMCGDSTKTEDFERLMDGYKAKLVITDPPYNVDYTGSTGMKILNDKMEDSGFRQFLIDAYSRMFESMMNGAPIYVFHADTEGYNFRGAFKEAGFKLSQNLVWVKNGLIMGRQDYHWKHEPILYGWKEGAAHFWHGGRLNSTVYEDTPIQNPNKMTKKELVDFVKDVQAAKAENSTIIYHDKPSKNDEHPTMKPIKLIAKLVSNSSERGDLILDSFGGSGSTLIAAEQTARTCHTMELDPIYCDVIVKRYEKLTGDKGVKING